MEQRKRRYLVLHLGPDWHDEGSVPHEVALASLWGLAQQPVHETHQLRHPLIRRSYSKPYKEQISDLATGRFH